jgi:hypothetical protein
MPDHAGDLPHAPHPAEPAAPAALPDALTFFLTRAERQHILRHLNTTAPHRTQALLNALGLSQRVLPQRPQRAQST